MSQEKFKQSQKQVNVFTKLPVGSTQIQAVSTTQPQQDVKAPQQLNCSQCSRVITFKPELVQIKVTVVTGDQQQCSGTSAASPRLTEASQKRLKMLSVIMSVCAG